jgi:hypothetical protein
LRFRARPFLPKAKKIQADSPVFCGKEAPLYGALKSKKCARERNIKAVRLKMVDKTIKV